METLGLGAQMRLDVISTETKYNLIVGIERVESYTGWLRDLQHHTSYSEQQNLGYPTHSKWIPTTLPSDGTDILWI